MTLKFGRTNEAAARSFPVLNECARHLDGMISREDSFSRLRARLLLPAGIVEHLHQTPQTARVGGRIIDALKDVRVVGNTSGRGRSVLKLRPIVHSSASSDPCVRDAETDGLPFPPRLDQ